jgi:hypothetical protein
LIWHCFFHMTFCIAAIVNHAGLSAGHTVISSEYGGHLGYLQAFSRRLPLPKSAASKNQEGAEKASHGGPKQVY